MQVSTETSLFVGRAHWLDIAVVLSDRELTQAECARALAVDAATIRRPLREMRAADLLEVDDESLRRGTHYWLRPDLVERLEDEIARDQPIGVLGEDQPLMMVEVPTLLDLARVLLASDLSRTVIWIAELDAGGRFLLALDGNNVSSTHQIRLRAAIETGGGSCSSSRVRTIMSGRGWRRLLATARDSGAAAG